MPKPPLETAVQALAESWRRQPWPLRILRLFLGATFLYAGMQKLADPNFLHAGGTDFIGSQLVAFAHGSPIHGPLSLLAKAPVLAGVGVALLETAVGLATLVGVAPVLAAAVGLGINVLLFLSASWHVHPYFLGSDSIYAVAWLALLVGLTEERRRAAQAARARTRRHSSRAAKPTVDRRALLRGALVAGGTLLLGGLARAVAGSPTRTAVRALGPSASGSRVTHTAAPPAGETPVASLDSIPVGGAIGFNDPSQGPSVLLRLGRRDVVAYGRTCTHAGCLVEWDQQNKLLVCPCHGAAFDPAHQASVVGGPAPAPLASIPVAIKGGEVVATG